MLRNLWLWLTSRKYRTSMKVSDFMHRNPDLLVIVCDPKTDTIMTGYRNFATAGRIEPDKANHKTRSKVISSVLSYSRVDKSIDRFLLQIDGAVYNIAKALRDKRKGEVGPTLEDVSRLTTPSDRPIATA